MHEGADATAHPVVTWQVQRMLQHTLALHIVCRDMAGATHPQLEGDPSSTLREDSPFSQLCIPKHVEVT